MRAERRLEARITDEHMDKLENLANSIGMCKTDVIRLLIANAYVDADGSHVDGIVILDGVTMTRLLRQTRAMGNNLNQTTHALNAIAKAMREQSDDPTAVLDVMEALGGVRYLLTGYEEARLEVCRAAEALSGRRGLFISKADAESTNRGEG